MHVSTDDAGPATAAPGARLALGLLLGINLFNYIDRQVLSAVLPKLKRDSSLFEPTDPDLNTKLGLLTTAFMVTYMILSPVFAWGADHFRRWFVVGIGVGLWSLASGSSGMATTYAVLLLTRCFVGIGEAAYGPIAPAMISDLFPVKTRGKILAYFYAAIPVGSALGFVLGGFLSDHFGWRHAFWLTYIGLIPALLCFLMPEPPRIGKKKEHEPGYIEVLKELLHNRSFMVCTLGMTCTTFVLGGVAVWVPEYIFEREAKFAITTKAVDGFETDPRFLTLQGTRMVPAEVVERMRSLISPSELNHHDLEIALRSKLNEKEYEQYSSALHEGLTAPDSITTGQIGLFFGVILVVGGLVATLAGGAFGDWLRSRGLRGAYFHAAGWTTLMGWPFFIAMLYIPFPYAWIVLFFGVFFLFFNTGPANTILANVCRSPIRATAFAINILCIHALGDALSPTVIGFITDRSSLHTAFVIVSFLILIGGGLWIYGERHLDGDTEQANKADEAHKAAGH